MTRPHEIQATVNPLYAVPIMHAHAPDPERLNADLRALFLAMEAEGDRHRDVQARDNQYRIFESRFHLHRNPAPPVRMLFDFIDNALKVFVQGMNDYSDEQMENIEFDMHSWFHVTRTGGFQGAHSHPNASWSAIYCVDPGDPGSNYSGAVRFHDPRAIADGYRDPGNENLKIPYRLGSWQLNHKPGQMIVFPSYLVHEIFPYEGQRPRIVVALNAWARWIRAPI